MLPPSHIILPFKQNKKKKGGKKKKKAPLWAFPLQVPYVTSSLTHVACARAAASCVHFDCHLLQLDLDFFFSLW